MSLKKNLGIAAAFLLLGIGAAGALSTRWPSDGLEISEVRGDWGNVYKDSEGSYQGFIEIYNASDQPLAAEGWNLSNSKNNLQKYTLPDYVIAPGEYRIFWTEFPRSGEDYLGYSIRSGDWIFLSNASGKVVDKVKIPPLEKGYSYAVNGQDKKWSVCAATPRADNKDSQKPNYVNLEAPSVSIPSGFYDSAVDIEIQTSPECEIYYTLDGSIPSEKSNKYSGVIHLEDPSGESNRNSMRKDTALVHHKYLPKEERNSYFCVQTLKANPDDVTEGAYAPQFPIPKIQVLRCVAVDSYGNRSPEVYRSYFIDCANSYGFKNVHMLSMIVNPDDLFSDENGIYVCGDLWQYSYENQLDRNNVFWPYSYPTNYNISGKDRRRPAYMELFGPDGQHVSSQMTGITIHGGWSTAFNQKGFNVMAFPQKDGEEVLFPGVLEHDYRTVMLRPGGFRDTYYTKLRDALNQELVSDRNITTLHAVPCQVFINGEYWGLYNLQERIHQNTIAEKYGYKENNLIVLKTWQAIAGRPEDYDSYNQMVEFAKSNDLSVPSNYTVMTKQMDIQSYIDYMCMEIYAANADSLANNFAMWRTRHAVDDGYGDGRWRWIIYDTDDSMGMVEGSMSDASTDSFRGGHFAICPATDELFTALCKNETFKRQFADTFIEMAQTNYAPDRVENILKNMAEQYCEPAVLSQHRFLSEEFTEEDYNTEIEVIRDFFQNRNSYIYNYMVETLELEQYGYEKQPVQ